MSTIELPTEPTHLHLATATKVRAVRLVERFVAMKLPDGYGGERAREYADAGDYLIGSDAEDLAQKVPCIVPGLVFEACYREL